MHHIPDPAPESSPFRVQAPQIPGPTGLHRPHTSARRRAPEPERHRQERGPGPEGKPALAKGSPRAGQRRSSDCHVT
jgi:hypothetical protein